MSVVASLAGDDNPVKQQMAGVRSLLGVLRAGQDSGQEMEQQQPPPWRQVRFEEEPDGTKAKSKVGSEGKQGKAAKQSEAKGDLGKQGQAGAQARTMVRPKLRAQDWHGSILDYDAVCTQLNSVAGPVFIWVRDAEQADAMSQMLLGAGAKCTARMVWKAAAGTLKIPVELDGDIAIETFSFVDYTTAGVPPPTFKQAAATAKKVPKETVTTTLRVALARDFVTKEAWSQAVAAPRAAIQKWSREAVKVGNEPFVKDACGFAEEERLGRPAVVGLIRVPVSKVAEALTSSGTKGVFVEPASRDDVVKCKVAWLEPLEGETWVQAVDRAKELKPQYGIFLGKRQVGMRNLAGGRAKTSRTRYFALKNTPASWSDDLVRDLIEEQTSLRQVGVYRKHTAKGSATWYFKARAEEDAGCYMLKVEDGTGAASLWVTPVRGEVVRNTRPIHEKGGFVFQRPAPRGADKPEAKAKPEEDKAEEPPTKKPAVARPQRCPMALPSAKWTGTATASSLWWALAWGDCGASRRCSQRGSEPKWWRICASIDRSTNLSGMAKTRRAPSSRTSRTTCSTCLKMANGLGAWKLTRRRRRTRSRSTSSRPPWTWRRCPPGHGQRAAGDSHGHGREQAAGRLPSRRVRGHGLHPGGRRQSRAR